MHTTTTKKTPPLVAAYNLLGRMRAAAVRSGDIGREFVVGGVSRFLAFEITFRGRAAQAARAIETDVANADTLLARAQQPDSDGGELVTVDELRPIRLALTRPRREAHALADELQLDDSRVGPGLLSGCDRAPELVEART